VHCWTVVGKIKVIAGLVMFALVMSTGWQIAFCEFNNYLLKDDLKDVSAMGAARIGLDKPESDDDLRAAVIHRAAEHHVRLVPDQILVRRSGTHDNPVIFLAAKYQARVWMPGFALIVHYTATSKV
jgi:hypothetical protein